MTARPIMPPTLIASRFLEAAGHLAAGQSGYRFEAIEQFAEKQVSLWLSVREAAWRHERETLELHCPQIRILTLATFDAVRALDAGKEQEAGS